LSKIVVIKTHAAIFDRDNPDDGLEEKDWSAIIWNRMTRVLRTHAFKIDIDHMFNVATNNSLSTQNPNSNIVQGEL